MQNVILEKSNRVARLTLNNPPLNIITLPMMRELNDALALLKEDRAVTVIVIAANGKAFSAGTDIRDHYPDRAVPMLKNFHTVFHTLWSLEPPIVAAVRGAALGGGCELALACDFIIASERATFGQPEIRVGAFAPIASLLLPRRVGEKRALELLLTGKTLDAREAERIGLVNRVVAADAFDAGVAAFVNELTAQSGAVLRVAKRAARLGAGAEFAATLAHIETVYARDLLATRDAVEGLDAFLQKRAPAWTDQ